MDFNKQKQELIEVLKDMGITDSSVLSAIEKVPRERFVPKEFLEQSYDNYPLPIAGGQTISQPYTVALMLQALELKKGDKVFEIGTGSGWNAALISKIVGKEGVVYTTEIVPELIQSAKKNLKEYKNVNLLELDGSKGYEKESPYDKIIVTVACPDIPKPLIQQLKENGILVAPVGPQYSQIMVKLTKIRGKIERESLGNFVFVPLKGEYGYK